MKSLKQMRRRWLGWLVIGWVAAAGPEAGWAGESPFFQAGKVRVLILSGRNNHDWRTTTPFLRGLLTGIGRFDVRVCEEAAGLTSATLEPYDVLVIDYCGPRWGEATERAVEGFVKGGKGMVVVHGAAYAFSGLEVLGDGHVGTGIREPVWEEYRRMVGGYWRGAPAKGYHGQRHSFTVRWKVADHPVRAGLSETFVATDELYHGMELLPGVTVLATARDAEERGGTGGEEPILWANPYGAGRVFYTALGHEVAAMEEAGFRTMFVRAVEWAATGRVTLPVAAGLNRSEAAALRVLVVTGGHDYDTSFYEVFRGRREWVWRHEASNQAAFRNDLRGTVDVLVLYDLSQDLDERGRGHLRAFVESGKGLVVLHHAIADYNGWRWWWEEVVGGRYLLEPEGGRAGSTYAHDQEMFVEPVGSHPITRDIGAMHLWDETYRGMWISPRVEVLMRTTNATSDGPVVWVSPYERSRVVYVQLGHDRTAHEHPAYQRLVRNAILWSAGRLK